MLDARVQRRQQQAQDTQDKLIAARVRLTRLERNAEAYQKTLASNLVAAYKTPAPDLLGVAVEAKGFDDLLSQLRFLRDISDRNATILRDTRSARLAVASQTKDLAQLRLKLIGLAKQASDDRSQANVLRNALLRRQASQLARRSGAQSRLNTVRARIASLERQQAADALRNSAPQGATDQAPPAPAPGGPPAQGDDAIAKVVAAANQIATTPYVWGGGHGGSASGGYDCSGSLSYALAAAGLVNGSLTSGGFMSWGDAGPGRRITVYANGGHAFMIVDGRRYDTSALQRRRHAVDHRDAQHGGLRRSPSARLVGHFLAVRLPKPKRDDVRVVPSTPRGKAVGGAVGGGGLIGIVVGILALLGVFAGSGGINYNSPFDQFPQAPQGAAQDAVPGAPSTSSDLVDFLRFVTGDINDFWSARFNQAGGTRYRATIVNVFTGSVRTGCGNATSDVGPFYCPADQQVYLDVAFFRELDQRFRAPGDFAQAYVVAHEIGHHVQNITGIFAQVDRARRADPGQANQLSIRTELQADCLAGVWGHSTYERGLLESGDLEEGLAAAAAVGDDRIQSQVTGQVNPETWTHGSSEQRTKWFRRGFDSGDPASCDTFSNDL